MAGGLGKRMKSELPKVLHPVGGLPMLSHGVKRALSLEGIKSLHIVVGQYQPVIDETLKKTLEPGEYARVKYAIQETPLGTGHAIQCALPHLRKVGESGDRVLVLSGDVPLITRDTLEGLLTRTGGNDFTLLANRPEDPTGCGRVLLTEDGAFDRIVEEKDATAEQRKVRLSNCGIYVFRLGPLLRELPKINNNNAQSEYYLPDVVPLINNGKNGAIYELSSEADYQVMNINNPEQLAKADGIWMSKN